MPSPERRVQRVWVRPEPGAAMVERESVELLTGRGVSGDHTLGQKRHVTLVFQDDWAAAEGELGRKVDPAGRRANVLLSGGDGQQLVGRVIRLGGAQVEIMGITRPCPVMEQAAVGLENALAPDGRAGVWGRILEGAEIRPGDLLSVEELA